MTSIDTVQTNNNPIIPLDTIQSILKDLNLTLQKGFKYPSVENSDSWGVLDTHYDQYLSDMEKKPSNSKNPMSFFATKIHQYIQYASVEKVNKMEATFEAHNVSQLPTLLSHIVYTARTQAIQHLSSSENGTDLVQELKKKQETMENNIIHSLEQGTIPLQVVKNFLAPNNDYTATHLYFTNGFFTHEHFSVDINDTKAQTEAETTYLTQKKQQATGGSKKTSWTFSKELSTGKVVQKTLNTWNEAQNFPNKYSPVYSNAFKTALFQAVTDHPEEEWSDLTNKKFSPLWVRNEVENIFAS